MTKKLGNTNPVTADLGQTEAVKCPECGGQVFEQAIILRKLSALLTGTGQPGLIPISTFKCSKCGVIQKEFLPVGMQDIDI